LKKGFPRFDFLFEDKMELNSKKKVISGKMFSKASLFVGGSNRIKIKIFN
jgi:hypothetical protein